MKKFVIIGANSFGNRGVEALCMSIIDRLYADHPDADVTLLCKGVDFNRRQAPDCPATFRDDAYRANVPKACHVLGVLFTPIPRLLWPDFAQARDIVRSADVLISTGGDNFGKDYGPFQNHLTPMMEAQDAGVATAFLGQSIGPFKSGQAHELFRSVAAGADLVTCRETVSYEFCLRDLGLDLAKTHRTADVAFLLPPAPETRVREILDQNGLGAGGERIAISVSGGIAQFSRTGGDSHLDAWVGIVRGVRERTGAEIVLIPHVWSDETAAANNDLIACRKVAAALGDGVATVLEGTLTASEFKGVIGTSDFVIAERTHAAIAGLSQGVPTFSVGYSTKAVGITGDLFADRPADARPLLDIQSLVADPDAALETFVRHYDDRRTLAEGLAARLPETKALAARNFELLRDLV